MEPNANQAPLVVIVGPTASGKTSLAVELATRFNGEIICADSRTVYKGMDIGTAKPSPQEKAKIPHHLLDISTPDHPITAADFKVRAVEMIDGIAARGNISFLVGGTGLYIDAVIFDFAFRGKADQAVRKKLESLSVEQLQQMVHKLGLPLPPNARNPRHLIRQIESGGRGNENSHDLRNNTLVLGLEVNKTQLEERLAARLDDMFHRGLEEEVRRLSRIYGWDCQALLTIGYQEFKPYFEGECSLSEVKDAILRHSLQYAKRQKTWFKRNKRIRYIYNLDESVELITTFLNKKV